MISAVWAIADRGTQSRHRTSTGVCGLRSLPPGADCKLMGRRAGINGCFEKAPPVMLFSLMYLTHRLLFGKSCAGAFEVAGAFLVVDDRAMGGCMIRRWTLGIGARSAAR